VELHTNREATYTGYTDAQGNLFFRVSPGRYDLPPDVLGAPNDHIAVFCTEASSPNTQIKYTVTIAKGEHITCDLYLLPA